MAALLIGRARVSTDAPGYRTWVPSGGARCQGHPVER